MSFPKVKFGICPRCGRGGVDKSSGSALTGYELKLYQGEWLCQLCINYLEDLAHDELSIDRIIEEEKAREQAGFTR